MHDDFNFDWKFYISHYPDLRKSKITTENKAIHHWNNFGKKEGRICCAKKIEHPDIVQLKEIIKSLEHKIDKLSEIKHKLQIIIPVRDREKELKILLDKLDQVLKEQNIQYKILIAEQSNNKEFNKGALINAAYLESRKNIYSDYYVFHDVDLYPKKSKYLSYKYENVNKIRHPYGHYSCLGGIVFMHYSLFEKINGFPNNFWGHGGEDTDLQNRALIYNIEIDRNDFNPRHNWKQNNRKMVDDFSEEARNWSNIENLKNKHKIVEIKNNNLKEIYNIDKTLINMNGLTSLKYQILEKKYLNSYTQHIIFEL
jgi:hypothetical protein